MSPVLTPVSVVETKAKPTSVRLTETQMVRLDKAAAQLGLTRTQAIGQLLEYALTEHEKQARRKAKR